MLLPLLFLVACSNGADAPPVGNSSTVCTSGFCIDVPEGWDGEVGDTFLSFHHESSPDDTFLTANTVDLEAIVTAAGGTWPATTEESIRSFWSLLDDAGEGELIRTERMVGGAIRSIGTHSTGDMWFVLLSVDGSRGIGIELRAPNRSWETHADAVFSSIDPEG